MHHIRRCRVLENDVQMKHDGSQELLLIDARLITPQLAWTSRNARTLEKLSRDSSSGLR